MTAEILAVGTELLLGDIVNTNAKYLACELALMGFGVLHQAVVGDNPKRLSDAVKQALSRSDMLITTGGLGPTGDDITRETVASVLGLELELDSDALRGVEEYFRKTGRPMGENNKKQVMLPHGCIVLKNDWGTAPGCIIEHDGKTVVMLPGPPREMEPIFEQRAKPYLAKYCDGVIESVSLREFGIPESKAEEMLADLMRGANPTLAPYAKDGEVLLRVTARADTCEKALSMCRPIVQEVKKRLGDSVYGENVGSLEQVVVEKLRQKKLKVSFAESCTGGLLAKRLTDISGSSEVFDCGIVSYANEIKRRLLGVNSETLDRYGAVSPQTAAEMAQGVRKLAGADIGAGITGIAGPGGGTDEKPVGLVYVSVCDGKTCYVKKLLLGHGVGSGSAASGIPGSGERELIRYLAASNVLDMVRRLIDGLPQTGSANGSLTVIGIGGEGGARK
jgi:nicotinamide-nucleotide amidase